MRQKYFKYLNTLFVVTPMTFIMALVGLYRTYGFGEGALVKFFLSWTSMIPVAYLAAFIIIPNARKLALHLTAKEVEEVKTVELSYCAECNKEIQDGE